MGLQASLREETSSELETSRFSVEQMERWDVSKALAQEKRCQRERSEVSKALAEETRHLKKQGIRIPSANDILAQLAPAKSAKAYKKAWDDFCEFLTSPVYSSLAGTASQGMI